MLRLVELLVVITFVSSTIPTGAGFQCSSDTILRFGVEKRAVELKRECGIVKNGVTRECESRDEVGKAWKSFVDVSDLYSKAVKECRETVERDKKKEEEKKKKPVEDGGEAKNSRMVRRDLRHLHDEHDQHTGHRALRRRRYEIDATDYMKPEDFQRPTAERRRRALAKRRPHRCTTREMLRAFRTDGTNPCLEAPLPFLAESAEAVEESPRSRRELAASREVDAESALFYDRDASRFRRDASCLDADTDEIARLMEKYSEHCRIENICLPDEDLSGAAAEDFRSLHKQHAATYSAYVRELAACYGSLTT